MPFIARKNTNRRSNVVNRGSLLFRIKSAIQRKKAKVQTSRKIQTRAETPAIKRKFGLLKKINPKVIRALIAAGSFLLLSILILGLTALIRDPYYSIKTFTVIGNNSVTDNKIQAGLQEFKGKSIFLLELNDVKKAVQDNYINLLSVELNKVYPDTVFIKITEKEPRIILVNLNGAYLIDEDASIINVLSQSKINYDQARLDLVSGFADENSPVIKEIFLNKFIEERKIATLPKSEQDAIIAAEYSFENIPLADKVAEYTKIKGEIQNEIDALTGEVMRKIQTSDFAYLPQVILLNNRMYEVNQVADKKRLELTLELIRYFSNPLDGPTIVGHLYWKGEMLVEVSLSNATKVIFGVLKKPSYQLEDYEIIVNYLVANQKKYSQIDLSSTKISVK